MKKLIQASLVDRSVEMEFIERARSVGSAVCNRELSYYRFAKLLVG